MERLTLKQRTLAQALKQLNDSVNLFYLKKQLEGISHEEYIAFRDSVVKRFEISFDLLWKYLKEFLFEVHGIEVASPRKVIRESFAQGLFTEDEMNLLIKMCNDRNLTAHTYDEDHSAEVAERVIEYYYKIKPALFRVVEQK
ncbi:MAG: HI0074 family nucleotidyltransferase substrate-binding subunit [Candidatus Dependentiae bacterium]